MKQRINLYVPKVKVRTPLGADLCALIVLIVGVGLAAVLWDSSAARHEAATRLAKAQDETKKLEARLIEVQKRLAPIAESPQLKAQLRALDEEIAFKQKYRSLLETIEPEQQRLFSGLLEGLATQAVDGIWLTRIQADEAGHSLSLDGYALRADLIPLYIQRLGYVAEYEHARFDGLVVEADDQLGHRFEVSAQIAERGLFQ